MREFEISYRPGTTPDEANVIRTAARTCGVPENKILKIIPLRRSIDARGESVLYRLRMEAWLKGEEPESRYVNANLQNVSSSPQVIIVGAGPAGMFAALTLIEAGLKPVIVERGKDVHSRKYDIALINREQVVNPDSGYCFGEGGAGTFSDGKLYTRSVKRGNVFSVLSRLTDAGASPDIMLDAHPHIGTDKLPAIVENIRDTITGCGGEYHFSVRIEDLIIENGRVTGVRSSRGEVFRGSAVILATGHSARDVYKMLDSKGVILESKGFALGVRMEHDQKLINNIQYHGKFNSNLPNAEYSLAVQSEGRGVFSFCMCPGGILVPASTSPGELVLNGMSNSLRNSRWANSGVVVSINPGDVPEYEKYGSFALLEFQSAIERRAFDFGGGNLIAPAQRVTDFMKGKISDTLPASSYVPGIASASIEEILPEFVTGRLKDALRQFDRKMRGYINSDALMLATESRTSSPVRIPRDPDTMESIHLKGLYPCGEGAGYAGGIVSSALDGINVANAITVKH